MFSGRGFKPPKDDSKYSWTSHVVHKMIQYGISEGRIKRIIRFPKRIEEGIAPNTVAAMQPAFVKTMADKPSSNNKPTWTQEIWVMYRLAKRGNSKSETLNPKQKSPFKQFSLNQPKLKIITVWRYPGVSPERDAVPQEIIQEVQRLL